MCTYSNQDLADMYGTSKRTLETHINKLKDKKLFEKSAIGKFYNQTDAEKLSTLLGFVLTKNRAKESK